MLFGHEKKGKSSILMFEYDETDSTNRRARCYVQDGGTCLPALFTANSQIEGRGRMGRSFYSPPQGGLYMSLLIKAPQRADRFIVLTALCAVAVAQTIYEELGASVEIKWVNDLYLNGRKVAGILAEGFEHEGERYAVLGIGINLSTKEFPAELCDKAGRICDKELSKNERTGLAMAVSERIIKLLEAEEFSPFMERYRELSCVIGKDISFTEGGHIRQGRAVDITPMGALLVRLSDGTLHELSTGEISVVVH